ncbi:hypothetical protein [Streptomonospora salina]|uniref:Uncharacterized protein n=1 Tax=Streptomonospora salina TaxID=104205 RepID=A0A841E2N9_9ACTN|nr:hypothetical protein [Streptomonospora salina]MBB5997296.1 hypothetical protein [Streptomonospora salina]
MWLTTESDPAALTASSVAKRLVGEGRTAHLVWNPRTGETVQLLPATAPAGGELTPNLPDRACEGRACITITVIGWSDAPFTDAPLRELAPILSWLDTWEVPRRWPAGTPPAGLPSPRERARGERLWARGGHFGHSQVPGAHATTPGAVSPDVLLGRAEALPEPARSVPAPPPALPVAGFDPDGDRRFAGAASG